MSIGYGGYAELIQADDTMLIYAYCCYNLNREGWRADQEKRDGEIYVDRDALVEPILREKRKRTPSGKKKRTVRRVRREVPLLELLESGQVTVKNASGTWRTLEPGVDMIACRLLRKLFDEYQDTGEIPEGAVVFW